MNAGISGGGRHTASPVDLYPSNPYNPNFRGEDYQGRPMSPNSAALEVAARLHRNSAGSEREFTGGPGRASHAGQQFCL
jgi:hypothetical protein